MNDSIISRSGRRVAVISDIHGNAPALRAVLEQIEGSDADLVVSLGDATWGSQPEEVRELLESVALPTIFVRGNAERALWELHRGRDPEGIERVIWMRDHHSEQTHQLLEQAVLGAIVSIDELGDVRFCHGSPRSDIEVITPETPEERIRALMEGAPQRILVSAHTHIQFDRQVAGIRSINPGSVGMPAAYTNDAHWAILGPGVELMVTPYDIEESARAYEASGDPLAEQMIELLREPWTPEYVMARYEPLEFSE